MDVIALRTLVRMKIRDGYLPHHCTPRAWGGYGYNQTCVACDLPITRREYVLEGLDDAASVLYFHVKCFYIWDSERGVKAKVPRAS